MLIHQILDICSGLEVSQVIFSGMYMRAPVCSLGPWLTDKGHDRIIQLLSFRSMVAQNVVFQD